MTRDDVIRLAREADCIHVNLSGDMAMATERLSRFAEAMIESVAQHIETSSDRYRRDYFAAKVRELKTQAPAQPAGKP